MSTHSHDDRSSDSDEPDAAQLAQRARAALESARGGANDDPCARVADTLEALRERLERSSKVVPTGSTLELQGLERELRVEHILCTVKAHGAHSAACDELAGLVASFSIGTIERARAQHVLGITLARLAQYAEAISFLCYALDGYRLLDKQRELAEVEDTLGMVHAAQGRFDLAAAAYARSITRKLLVGDKRGMAISLGNLGRAHLEEGRFEDARGCFELDLALSREIPDDLGVVRMSIDLATVLRELKRYGEARSLLSEALSAARKLGQSRLEFDALRQSAWLELAEERFDTARSAIEAARTLGGDLEGGLFAASCDEILGWIRIGQGDLDGRGLVERAIDFYKQHGKFGREIATRLELVQRLVQHGFKAEAERHLMRAAERAERDGFAFHRRRIRELQLLYSLSTPVRDVREPILFASEDAPNDAQAYYVLEKLGAGGFGDVYRAYDAFSNRVVALKILRLEELYEPARRDLVRQMIQTEFSATNGRDHPGIARVYAIGKDDRGQTYVVQEYVAGRSLAHEVKAGRPSLARFTAVMGRIADALAELHYQGVEHRDLKPENVMIRASNGRPVLIDFGIAHTPTTPAGERVFAGTLAYMAPERILRRPSGPPADVYALGVLARVWLHLPMPTEIALDHEALDQAVFEPARASMPVLPESLASMLDACLAYDASRRPTASAMAEVFTNWRGADEHD